MDKIDLKLISLLQKNSRIPLKALAAEVFLSSPATAARIEKLENDGMISGYSATLDHKKLGFPITAFINLEMHPQDTPDFYPFQIVFSTAKCISGVDIGKIEAGAYPDTPVLKK